MTHLQYCLGAVCVITGEVGLLRYDVLAQIQTIAQFEFDSKPLLTIIFAGQNNLLDKLEYHTSMPMASRVVCRSHLEIAGIKDPLFADEAVPEGPSSPPLKNNAASFPPNMSVSLQPK